MTTHQAGNRSRPMTAPNDTLLALVLQGPGSIVVDGDRVDASALELSAKRAAAGYSIRGISAGDGVMIVDNGSGVELLAALLGAWWVGARATLLSSSTDAEQVRAIRAEAGASLLVRSGALVNDGELAFG